MILDLNMSFIKSGKFGAIFFSLIKISSPFSLSFPSGTLGMGVLSPGGIPHVSRALLTFPYSFFFLLLRLSSFVSSSSVLI